VIKVLLADDQAVIRDGLRVILEARGTIEVVGEAEDGIAAVELTRRRLPDVVLMDIRMPRMDGIEATRRIVKDSSARVLVLTTFGEDEYVYATLKAGASGFLLKDTTRDQLAEAVRLVADGEQLLAPSVTRTLIEQFVRRRPPPQGIPPELAELTAREAEVARLVARGLSNAEIGAELVVSAGTVRTHVTHILQKLALRDRVQVVVLAYECGLIEPGARPTEPPPTTAG
jgi:DNA-binding NarL/FixJ family response regulator